MNTGGANQIIANGLYGNLTNGASASNVLRYPKGSRKFRGVFPAGRKFRAVMQVDGVRHNLGMHETEIEAARAYDKFARENYKKKNFTRPPKPDKVVNCAGTSSNLVSTGTTTNGVSNQQRALTDPPVHSHISRVIQLHPNANFCAGVATTSDTATSCAQPISYTATWTDRREAQLVPLQSNAVSGYGYASQSVQFESHGLLRYGGPHALPALPLPPHLPRYQDPQQYLRTFYLQQQQRMYQQQLHDHYLTKFSAEPVSHPVVYIPVPLPISDAISRYVADFQSFEQHQLYRREPQADQTGHAALHPEPLFMPQQQSYFSNRAPDGGPCVHAGVAGHNAFSQTSFSAAVPTTSLSEPSTTSLSAVTTALLLPAAPLLFDTAGPVLHLDTATNIGGKSATFAEPSSQKGASSMPPQRSDADKTSDQDNDVCSQADNNVDMPDSDYTAVPINEQFLFENVEEEDDEEDVEKDVEISRDNESEFDSAEKSDNESEHVNKRMRSSSPAAQPEGIEVPDFSDEKLDAPVSALSSAPRLDCENQDQSLSAELAPELQNGAPMKASTAIGHSNTQSPPDARAMKYKKRTRKSRRKAAVAEEARRALNHPAARYITTIGRNPTDLNGQVNVSAVPVPVPVGSTSEEIAPPVVVVDAEAWRQQVRYHWRGTLVFDPARCMQVWQGAWLGTKRSTAVPGDESATSSSSSGENQESDFPTLEAFQATETTFEYLSTKVRKHAMPQSALDNTMVPQSGYFKGYYKMRSTKVSCYVKHHDRNFYVIFVPCAVATTDGLVHEFALYGRGVGEYGAFIVQGSFNNQTGIMQAVRIFLRENDTRAWMSLKQLQAWFQQGGRI